MKTTWNGFSISFVTGPPGSGKSFYLAQDVVARLLSGFTGKIVTNLPLNVDVIAQHVASKLGVSVDHVAGQIVLLSATTLRSWQDGAGGPWELKTLGDAQGNDFILDECHLFCPKKGRAAQARNEKWGSWLGEVRHEGWQRCVFVTQDESKVGEAIKQHAELRFELTNWERRRDPFLKIPLAEWMEVAASFTREYRSAIGVWEYRRVNGKLKGEHATRVPLDPEGFKFYRSYVAAGGGAGGGADAVARVHEYQRRPVFLPGRRTTELPDGTQVTALWAPTWLWLVKAHVFRFALAGSLLGVMIWGLFFGGGGVMFSGLMSSMKAAISKSGVPKESTSVPVAVAPASSSPAAAPEPTLAPEFAGSQAPAKIKRGTPKQIQALLGRLPPADRALVVNELRSYSEDYKALDAKRKQLEVAAQAVKDKVRVVAFTNDTVWFSDPPCSCKIGKVLDDGPYKGRTVVKLAVDEGFVELEGGVKLWMGRGVEPGVSGLAGSQPAPGNSPAAGVAGVSGVVPVPVRSNPPVGAATQSAGSGGAVSNNNGAGDGLRSLLPIPGSAVGANNSVGGGPGVSPGNNGGAGATNQQSVVPAGSSNGGER